MNDPLNKSMAGALLHFYEPVTTLRIHTFDEKRRKIAQTNPVIADASGKFPEIHLQPRDYWVVLEDPNHMYIASFTIRAGQ